jgi:sugar O-acyltransferase (sialic acid O-acetyltransferase NeuD family)
MDKIVIFGTTQFSYMLHKMIEREDAAEVVAYTINERYMDRDSKNTYKQSLLYPFEQLDKSFPPNEYKILISIGYTKMNSLRNEIANECKKKGYEIFSFISKSSTILTELNGIGNIVLPGAYIGCSVEVGDHNVFYTGSIVTHDIKVKNYTFIAAGCTVGGNVTIGSNCFLGMNSTIKNGVSIADFSLIGASSYIDKDTEPFSVYVPERSIKLEKCSTEMF